MGRPRLDISDEERKLRIANQKKESREKKKEADIETFRMESREQRWLYRQLNPLDVEKDIERKRTTRNAEFEEKEKERYEKFQKEIRKRVLKKCFK